jgi:hypothetical protein
MLCARSSISVSVIPFLPPSLEPSSVYTKLSSSLVDSGEELHSKFEAVGGVGETDVVAPCCGTRDSPGRAFAIDEVRVGVGILVWRM